MLDGSVTGLSTSACYCHHASPRLGGYQRVTTHAPNSDLPSIVLWGLALLKNGSAKLQSLPLAHAFPSLLEAMTWLERVAPACRNVSYLVNTACASFFSSPQFAYIASFSLALYAGSASWWRVTTRLHSVMQTLVGACIGCITGYMAYSRQPQVMEAFYERLLVPFFGYGISASNDVNASIMPVKVPSTLKAYTLLVGFVLLYSKELKQWAKRHWVLDARRSLRPCWCSEAKEIRLKSKEMVVPCTVSQEDESDRARKTSGAGTFPNSREAIA